LLSIPSRIWFLLVTALLLSSCDSWSDTQYISPQQVTSSTPARLRIIEQSDLVLRVSINDEEEVVFSGREFADGLWRIPVKLIPFEDNQVSLKWFERALLLMEEFGEVFANPNNPVIRTDFNFRTSGSERFDIDCDGVSNLDERQIDSDPSVPEIGSNNVCVAVLPADVQFGPYVVPLTSNLYQPFSSVGIGAPVRRIQQDVQVRNTYDDTPSGYSLLMFTSDDAATGTQFSVTLQNSPQSGRLLQFAVVNGSAQELTDNNDLTCGNFLTPENYFCQLPFNWRELRWYTLELIEVERDVWEAAVIDNETDERVLIARMSAQLNGNLSGAAVRISQTLLGSQEECYGAFPPTTLHYRSAIVNDEILQAPDIRTDSPCVQVSGPFGSSDSHRIVDGEPLYSLTLGTL